MVRQILVCLFLTGCGVPSQINMVYSGSVSVKLDLSNLTQFFTERCVNSLGVGATDQQIAACVSNQIGQLAAYLNTLGH